MIVLSNGVRIFIDELMNKDIYLGIASFGFENDIGNIIGIAHLLEHILITFDPSKFVANASTARSYMSFWCRSIKGKSKTIDAVETLISWFFDENKIKDTFSISKIKDHIKELENEYYFRNEIFHCMDALSFLANGDLYNGGRISMLQNINNIDDMLSSRMHRIIGPNVVIFVKELDNYTLSLLSKTFGKLPTCPLTIPYNNLPTIKGKFVMMPSPFYTVMVNIKPTLDNILSMISLYEMYHLIDYETIGDQLYISISFINEDDFEKFIKGIYIIDFEAYKNITFNYGDDFLMNIYLSFPWIQHDIYDYITEINCNISIILKSLEDNIYNSIASGNYVAIYPNFSNVIFNKNDSQMHKIIVMDNNNFSINDIYNNTTKSRIKLMKKQSQNEIYIKYDDVEFISYVSLALGFKNKIKKKNDGVQINHQFSSEDIKNILESETFLKYSKSKPANMYQYLLLSFFVSGNSIEDILLNRESVLKPVKHFKNKIVFGKKSKYHIKTFSSFVCGLIKGINITNESLTNMMWVLKRKGLIYSLDFTKLDEHLYYVFMFTIYPNSVVKYITTENIFKNYCLVISEKGIVEDFSSMKKDIVIKLI
ncbi:putative metalloproteinase [Goatpox virus]|uniref:Metalloendopeptidase n=1 Tax=Goatpox virus TaxID=186805 RepID=A0A5C0PSR7_9POXV|nr:putative metalloproteinase [Goatpox virus]